MASAPIEAIDRGPRAGRILAVLGLLLTLGAGCRGNPTTFVTRLEDSRRLAADLRVEFSHAADASNRAVMADTDEAASAAVGEAEKTSKKLESDVTKLAKLLEGLSYADESEILSTFGARYAEYKKVDRRILELAAENTNLKARSLSFGAGRQTADAFQRALESIAPGSPAADRCRVDGLVAQAVLAVREIQVLQAPHIAEKDEAAMTAQEQQMSGLDEKARAALAALQELSPSSGPTLANALAQLEQFKAISRQIVQLSRRNTNVLSLDLALRKTPGLKLACDERLQALQAALAEEGPKSKR